jgi:hypothetical protein
VCALGLCGWQQGPLLILVIEHKPNTLLLLLQWPQKVCGGAMYSRTHV